MIQSRPQRKDFIEKKVNFFSLTCSYCVIKLSPYIWKCCPKIFCLDPSKLKYLQALEYRFLLNNRVVFIL